MPAREASVLAAQVDVTATPTPKAVVTVRSLDKFAPPKVVIRAPSVLLDSHVSLSVPLPASAVAAETLILSPYAEPLDQNCLSGALGSSGPFREEYRRLVCPFIDASPLKYMGIWKYSL